MGPRLPFALTMALAVAICTNIFAQHLLPDIRLALFAATLILYARTRVWFRISDHHLWMPMPRAALLASLALWIAENIGTATGTWLYSGQLPGQTVSPAKLGSWYLLLCVSFATVTPVSRRALGGPPPAPRPAPTGSARPPA